MKKQLSNLYRNDLLLFHNATHIPFCVFDNTPTDILRLPFIESMNCSQQTLLQCCARLKDTSVHTPILLSSHACYFALLRLDKHTNIMFGPIASMPLTYRNFCELNSSLKDSDDTLHLYRIAQQSPLMSLSVFANNICLYLKLAFNKILLPADLLSNEISYSTKPAPNCPVYLRHQTYEKIKAMISFQKQILPYILTGNLDGLTTEFKRSSINDYLRTSPFTTEELQRDFLSFATICCSAVLEKGLSADQTLPVFEAYTERVPSITTPTHFILLCQQISNDYCRLSAAIQQNPSESEIVNTCLHYILTHLYASITIKDLARHCGISPRTITRHFAQFYSMSASQCILYEKLKEAAFLLTHSEMTLSEISNQLGFSSQSHLTVAFKKQYLTTPLQYRNQRQLQ